MELQYGELIESLVCRSIEIAGSSSAEIERCCWMAVHEHHHGVMPSEYDIRPIDETLYISVLETLKKKIAC